MFSASVSPIAVDFGTASVKLLQVSGDSNREIVAAADIPIPESVRNDSNRLLEFYASEIPKAIQAGRFRGRKVVTAVPSSQTYIQHMQLGVTEGVKPEDVVKAQLQMQMGCSPSSIVVRTIEVADVFRNGQARKEMICFAISKDMVMRYVGLLNRCKLDVVGVQTELLAMTRAFEHLYRRDGDDEITTLYVDLGWGGTRVAITHGQKLVFARYVQVGGRHFDTLIAGALHCELMSAQAHRLAFSGTLGTQTSSRKEKANAGGVLGSAMAAAEAAKERAVTPASTAVAEERRGGLRPKELATDITPCTIETTQGKLDLSELLDTITDELSACLRYHRALNPDRPVDRVIFVGGEARQMWMCQHVVKELGLPAQLGDPLARLKVSPKLSATGLSLDEPQPGWSVTYGLCLGPSDA
ncbi:MAG: pilus assembly protein PilM [Phycisphaerales bacterium]|nr:pilus assembly protein PilM [Phycisphaerales bacterium]